MQNAFSVASNDEPRYRSGAVARMLGMPVSTLRIWERRYQVVGPAQTASGHRLYSGADVERLLLVKQLSDLGHAIGSVARLPTAALQEIADARVVLAQPAATAPAPRPGVAMVGLGLPRRLGALAPQRVGAWPDLASAEAALAEAALLGAAQAPAAELLVADLATLQPDAADRLLALARRLGARRGVVVYGFGSEPASRRLREAGWWLQRSPLADADLRTLVADALATLAPAAAAAVPPAGEPPPRRFDAAALQQLTAASTTVACECPRHVAELVLLLGHFETYSAECVNRSPQDAVLHAHLQQVAGSARAMFEQALLRVAEAEGIPLPPAPVA